MRGLRSVQRLAVGYRSTPTFGWSAGGRGPSIRARQALFWASILQLPQRLRRGRCRRCSHSGSLSALIALAPQPLYHTHGIGALTALEDQQLADLYGVLTGLFYVATGLFVLMDLNAGQGPPDWPPSR